MSTFIDAHAMLKLKPNTTAACNKIICETIANQYQNIEGLTNGQSLDDFCKTASTEDLLSEDFDASSDAPDEYEINFYDSCSYGFAEEISNMFSQMAPYLEDDSELDIIFIEDGNQYSGLTIKNGKLINVSRHDFYTDDSDTTSEDEIADAILHAAKSIKSKKMDMTELRKNLQIVSSLEEIINALNS